MTATHTIGLADMGPPTVPGVVSTAPAVADATDVYILQGNGLYHAPGYVDWLRNMAKGSAKDRLQALDIVAESWPKLPIAGARQLLFGEITFGDTNVAVPKPEKGITFSKRRKC